MHYGFAFNPAHLDPNNPDQKKNGLMLWAKSIIRSRSNFSQTYTLLPIYSSIQGL